LNAIEADAFGQIESLRSGKDGLPIIIDEAQRSKSLALAIKKIVDADRRKGQFVLTGSSNLFTNAEVADSLAGRIRTLKLWPLTISETERKPPANLLDWALTDEPRLDEIGNPDALGRSGYIELFLAGGFPETRQLALRPRQRAYRGYVDSVVDRDVADIIRIRKTDQLRRLVEQMAVRTALEIKVTELSKLLGLTRVTVDQYLDVLERLSLIIRLGAWSSGEGRREIKNAKWHFVDTGVAAALRRFNLSSFNLTDNPTALGGLVESFIFNELIRSLPNLENDVRLYHWRDNDQREIDILADAGSRLIGIEVKASTSVNTADFKHLDWFTNKGPGRKRTITKLVFYLGEQKLSFGDRRFALPVSVLWS